MIYTIIGTDIQVRDRAKETFLKLGNATSHIYSEQISTLEPLILATNLFGEPVIAYIIQVMDVASSKDELVRL